MPTARYFPSGIIFLGLLSAAASLGFSQQGKSAPPSDVVLVRFGEEYCPIIEALNLPLPSLQKIANEHGYVVHQRDDIAYIVPNSPRFYKQMAINDFLQSLPRELIRGRGFSLQSLPEAARVALETYFANIMPRLDYDSDIIVRVNIYATLPSAQSRFEKRLVGSVEGGLIQSVVPAPEGAESNPTTHLQSMADKSTDANAGNRERRLHRLARLQ